MDEFFKDLKCDYDFDKDAAKRICKKVLGDSLLKDKAKYNHKKRNVKRGRRREEQ